ncbi:MAG: endonuclease [Myxococcales bacterium]|nr:endonuclease [Myxococcales bacterium]
MLPPELDQLLVSSLEDEALSRKEQRSIRDFLRTTSITENQRHELYHRAFALAEAKIAQAPKPVLSWVEGIVKALRALDTAPSIAEARFSPGEDCLHALLDHLKQTRHSADICVFTITDNRLAEAIINLHQRGVAVRVITDNDKAFDRGSDANKLEDHGVSVKYDQTEHHMHHKYALFDRHTLVTGSYNWTRSAALHNHENIVVSSEPRLISAFTQNFAELWSELT